MWNLIQNRLYILFYVVIILIVGCANFPISQNKEPATIIIRNSSSIYIEEASIREVKMQNKHVRMGAISPLPAGVSQVIGRPTNPPKLPKEIIICWVDEAQKERCRQEDITAVLKGLKDPVTALVFEIRSRSEVRIYLENSHRILNEHWMILLDYFLWYFQTVYLKDNISSQHNFFFSKKAVTLPGLSPLLSTADSYASVNSWCLALYSIVQWSDDKTDNICKYYLHTEQFLGQFFSLRPLQHF